MIPRATSDEAMARALDEAVTTLDLADAEPETKRESVAERRRRRGAPRPSGLARVSLVRRGGSLEWLYERPPSRTGPRRMRRAGALATGAETISHFDVREVPPNQVLQAIETLDAKLTPKRGVRRWNGAALEDPAPIRGNGRALLLIHGTFSKSDMFFEELNATAEGRAFLGRAPQRRYEQILAFDHPTLSVSPILNALDLEQALAGYSGTIDVVCHSRGGLVASWWLKLARPRVEQVVYVGSPLEGTSLASPAQLKRALDGLAMIAGAVGIGAGIGAAFAPPAAGLLGTAAALMKVVGGAIAWGAHTPLIDAGVAIVPGLAAQSRVGNNSELVRLHGAPWPTHAPRRLLAITATFEPGDSDAPRWQFWKRWWRPVAKLAGDAADCVFDEANDLVVNTSSMTRICGSRLGSAETHAFGKRDGVHHCNYFTQAKTIDRLGSWLCV